MISFTYTHISDSDYQLYQRSKSHIKEYTLYNQCYYLFNFLKVYEPSAESKNKAKINDYFKGKSFRINSKKTVSVVPNCVKNRQDSRA